MKVLISLVGVFFLYAATMVSCFSSISVRAPKRQQQQQQRRQQLQLQQQLQRQRGYINTGLIILPSRRVQSGTVINTSQASSSSLSSSSLSSSSVEGETSAAEMNIPTNLPSDCGMDYVPLATFLATGQLAEADQFTRDALIQISGARDKGRDFVYFTDVQNIPNTDLGTIERLWNQFSNGKFGYSIQKRKWKQCKGDFELFCNKIGWNTKDGEVERKKRWFGSSEFIYNVKKAPEGHLPLTSALRGTSLIKKLLHHPVWDNDDWMKEP